MNMKVLLIGGTGYVGQKFQEVFQRKGLEYVNLSRTNIDYYDYNKLLQIIRDYNPKFVFNAAGFTGKPNVDQCEVAKSDTIIGNVLLPQLIGQACDSHDVPLVHVSSGCIYSGDKGLDDNNVRIGFHEFDEPNFSFDSPPCSFYSGSKALGEQVLTSFEKVYTCRLRIPFDEIDCNRNYLSKLQRYDKLYEATNSVSHREEFVEACISLALFGSEYGIYNVTNSGYVTTKDVVECIKKNLGVVKDYTYWENDEEFYSKGAATPRSNCVMDNVKLLSTGIDMRHCMDAIEMSLRSWKPE